MAESTTDPSVLTPGARPEVEDAAVDDTPTRPLAEPAKPDIGGYIWGTGRRKSSVARVRIKPAATEGQGVFKINKKEVKDYFHELRQQQNCVDALQLSSIEGKLDVFAECHGGGKNGQSEAVLLGVARALKRYDPTLEHQLREAGYLTRDPREVERKKYGQKGARRKFQFSKR